MKKSRKHHRGRKAQSEPSVDQSLSVVSLGSDNTMIVWEEEEKGLVRSIVIPDRAIPFLVKRLASWMEI
jgi:hypothetical protein